MPTNQETQPVAVPTNCRLAASVRNPHATTGRQSETSSLLTRPCKPCIRFPPLARLRLNSGGSHDTAKFTVMFSETMPQANGGATMNPKAPTPHPINLRYERAVVQFP